MDEVERMADMVTEYLPWKLPRSTRGCLNRATRGQSEAFSIVSRAPHRMLNICLIGRCHAAMEPPPA